MVSMVPRKDRAVLLLYRPRPLKVIRSNTADCNGGTAALASRIVWLYFLFCCSYRSVLANRVSVRGRRVGRDLAAEAGGLHSHSEITVIVLCESALRHHDRVVLAANILVVAGQRRDRPALCRVTRHCGLRAIFFFGPDTFGRVRRHAQIRCCSPCRLDFDLFVTFPSWARTHALLQTLGTDEGSSRTLGAGECRFFKVTLRHFVGLVYGATLTLSRRQSRIRRRAGRPGTSCHGPRPRPAHLASTST